MADYVNWGPLFDDHPRCEETTGYDEARRDYTRCGATAVAVVLSERGQRLYFMCRYCADHNVRHRAVKLIASNDKVLTRALVV